MVLKTAGGKELDLDISTLFKGHYVEHNSYANVILNQINSGMYNGYLIGNEKTLLDLGGNVGLFSLWAHDRVEKILSVEPTQSHINVFQELLDIHHITNVHICKAAISDKSGFLSLYENKSNTTMNSLVNSPHSTGIKDKVMAYGLYDFIVENRIDQIDFIKMDIEGSEMNVIPSEQFKKACPHIKRIFVEVHDFESFNFSLIGRNVTRIEQEMQAAGFKVKRHGPDGLDCSK